MGSLIYEIWAVCLLYSTEQTPYQLFSMRLWGAIPSHTAKGFVLNMTRQREGTPVYICSELYLLCSAIWAYEALSALSLDEDYKFDEWHLEDAKIENRFFTAPPFNIKKILTDFNKPAITLCQYHVDTIFSTHVIQCHPVNVVVLHLASWAFHSVYYHIISSEGKLKVLAFLFMQGYLLLGICCWSWFCAVIRGCTCLRAGNGLHKAQGSA